MVTVIANLLDKRMHHQEFCS